MFFLCFTLFITLPPPPHARHNTTSPRGTHSANAPCAHDELREIPTPRVRHGFESQRRHVSHTRTHTHTHMHKHAQIRTYMLSLSLTLSLSLSTPLPPTPLSLKHTRVCTHTYTYAQTRSHAHMKHPHTQTDTHECWTRQCLCRPSVLPPSGLVDSFKDACCCLCPCNPGLQHAALLSWRRTVRVLRVGAERGPRRKWHSEPTPMRTYMHEWGQEPPTRVFQGLRDDCGAIEKASSPGVAQAER